jgi:Uma2 family endonuclease
MATTSTLASLAEYEARTAGGERLEYSDGVLLPMPNNDSVHDLIKGELATALARQLPESALVVNEMAFEVTPANVRHPDVAVLLKRPPRVEGRRVQGSPDLAIEVVSESDTAENLDSRVELYLSNGARSVWVVWPRARRIDIHQPGSPTRHLRGGVLSGEQPIPDFQLALDSLFD